MKIETVTSAQNPKIKELLALYEKSRLRRGKKLFVAEGRREIGQCIAAGYSIRTLFVCPGIITRQETGQLLQAYRDAAGLREEDGIDSIPNVIEVPETIYGKIAFRGSTEGVIAEVRMRDRSLGDIMTGKSPLVVVLESVEKPGNLGAVLRSADAAGADAVIVCDPLTDLYNPNLIRASIGAVFSVPTVVATSEDTIKWLKDNNIQILTAQLQDSRQYYDTNMVRGTAIVLGTESTGLTDIWRKNADAHIRIPMLGRLDSLNVSVSAAILLYEAVRQRQTAK